MMTLKMQTMMIASLMIWVMMPTMMLMLMLVHGDDGDQNGQQQQELPKQRSYCNIRTNYMYALKNSSTETLQPAL